MPFPEIFLPGSLLLAKFFLRLFVDKTATWADVIAALLSLPVDIVFLAASLYAAKVIAGTGDVRTALSAFTICIVGSILIVVAWRRSDALFAKDKFVKAIFIAGSNYLISAAALAASIGKLTIGAAV